MSDFVVHITIVLHYQNFCGELLPSAARLGNRDVRL